MRRGALGGGYVLEEGKASSYSSTSKVKRQLQRTKAHRLAMAILNNCPKNWPQPGQHHGWLSGF